MYVYIYIYIYNYLCMYVCIYIYICLVTWRCWRRSRGPRIGVGLGCDATAHTA